MPSQAQGDFSLGQTGEGTFPLGSTDWLKYKMVYIIRAESDKESMAVKVTRVLFVFS